MGNGSVVVDVAGLERRIEHWFAVGAAAAQEREALEAFHELRELLERGVVRAAEPVGAGPVSSRMPVEREMETGLSAGQAPVGSEGNGTGWRVNAWVKRGILLGFRLGSMVTMEGGAYVDKHTYPARVWTVEDGVRVVPGGSSVRAGAHVGKGVVCVPPMWVNAGAFVDEGTMIDSHALVGSCAQVGKRVHLSAAAQIGGVLEPVNASPVILEDDVLVGGNCGVYEGTVVRAGAVLAAGTILTRGTPVYDVVHDRVIRATAERPLVIPAGAVVVPGSRAITKGSLPGLSVYTPIIVKYRDAKTELSLVLEELLR